MLLIFCQVIISFQSCALALVLTKYRDSFTFHNRQTSSYGIILFLYGCLKWNNSIAYPIGVINLKHAYLYSSFITCTLLQV
jgi:hypothetical protein